MAERAPPSGRDLFRVIPRLHIVSDDGILHRGDFLPKAAKIMETGGGEVAFHLRGPGTSGRSLFRLASALKEISEAAGGVLLINDRVDLAMALALPGAHLGQRSIPPEPARRILGPGPYLGLSVHGREEVPEGSDEHLDYLMVGTLFPSPSHPDGIPGGPKRIQEIREMTGLPLLGIGGITPERVEGLLAAGAHGVAVRGGIWDSMDPQEGTRVYLNALEGGGRR